MATIYKGTTIAWLSSSWKTLKTVASSEDPMNELNYTNSDMSTVPGWTKVGTAEITVTMMEEKQIITELVSGIDKQITATYARAEAEIQALRDKKQQLLAITMDT